MSHIPLESCEDRFLYKISSRNLSLGIFNVKNNGFIGVREKFGSHYLFTEFHWDTGAPFGTVHPFEKLDKLPDDIELTESFGSFDNKSKRPVAFDKPVADGGKGWYYVDTGEPDQNIRAINKENKQLFDWLNQHE